MGCGGVRCGDYAHFVTDVDLGGGGAAGAMKGLHAGLAYRVPIARVAAARAAIQHAD